MKALAIAALALVAAGTAACSPEPTIKRVEVDCSLPQYNQIVQSAPAFTLFEEPARLDYTTSLFVESDFDGDGKYLACKPGTARKVIFPDPLPEYTWTDTTVTDCDRMGPHTGDPAHDADGDGIACEN
jgi:hypothetical protein